MDYMKNRKKIVEYWEDSLWIKWQYPIVFHTCINGVHRIGGVFFCELCGIPSIEFAEQVANELWKLT